MTADTWGKNEKFVLNELKEIKTIVKFQSNQLTKITIDLERLKIKSTMWGLLAGSIPVIASILFEAFKHGS